MRSNDGDTDISMVAKRWNGYMVMYFLILDR